MNPAFANCPALATSLISHYSLDNVQDAVLQDEQGTWNGTLSGVSSQSGIVDTAGGFADGAVATVSNFDPLLNNGVSVSLWVNPLQLNASEARFVSKATSVQGANHYLMAGIYFTDALRFRLKTNGQTTTLISPQGVLETDRWQYVTFTYDGQFMRIYHDGSLVAQTAKQGNITRAAVPLALGNQPSGAGSRPFIGNMDDVRIYDGALDATQIAQLMAYRAGDCDEQPTDQTPPPAPEQLQATGISSSQVVLSWTAVQDEAGGSGLRGYEVQRNTGPIQEITNPGYLDTTVEPDTNYIYSVQAVDTAGNRSAKVEIAVTTLPSLDDQPPSIPTGLTIESVTATDAVISWQGSSDNGGSGVRSYLIVRNGLPWGELLDNGTPLQLIDSNLEPGTLYNYQIQAKDNVGNTSEAAQITLTTLPESDNTDDTAPPSPEGLQVNAVDSQSIALSWNAVMDEPGGSGLLGYEISRDDAAPTLVDNTQFVDNGLEADTQYRYSLVALDQTGNRSSAVSIVQKTAPIDAPTECQVDIPLVSHYPLDDAQSGVLSDRLGLWNGALSQTSSESGIVGAAGGFTDSTSAVVSNFDPLLSNGLSLSLWVNPQQLDSTEARFVSKATGVQSANHFFMAGIYFSDALRFRLKTNGQTTTLISPRGLLVANQWQYVTFTYDGDFMRIYHDGVQVAQTAKQGSIDSAPSVALALGNQPPGAGSRPFTGKMDDVRIYNGALNSPEIAQLMAHQGHDCSEPVADNQAPPVPESLQITDLSPTAVSLSWTAVMDEPQGSGLRGYRVKRGNEPALEITDTTFTDESLQPQTSYEYQVTAIDNEGNESAASALSVSTPPDEIPLDQTPPAVPTGLIASSIQRESVVLSWNPVMDEPGGSGLNGYRLTRDEEESVFINATTDPLVYEDTGLIADTTYTFSLTAVDNSGNESAVSNLSVTTQEEPDIPDIPDIPDTTAPPAPAGFVVTDFDEQSIGLSWNAVSDETGGSGLLGYEISRAGASPTLITGSTDFVDTLLEADTDYTYSLIAVDQSDNRSTAVSLSQRTAPISVDAECRVVTPLISHYRLDNLQNGVLPDESGVWNGSVTNVSSETGLVGSAGGFMENSVATVIDYDPVLSSAVSISLWINPENLNAAEARFVSKATGVQGSRHYLMVGTYNNDALRFRLRTNNQTTTLISPGGILKAAQWQYLTFTYDGQFMRIFHDGTQVAQVAKQGDIDRAESVALALGNQPPGAGNRPFTGRIDDVRLYQGALSTEEIGHLKAYRGGNCESALTDQTPPPSPQPLVATDISSSVVTLSWAAVEDEEGGSGLRSYQVLRDSGLIAEVNDTAYTDNSIEPDTDYEYTLQAIDNAGNASLPATLSVSTEPIPVAGVNIEIISPNIQLRAMVDEPVQLIAQLSDSSFDAQVVWMSDKDGLLGTGATLETALSTAGIHEITATIADGDGLESTDNITANIISATITTPSEPIQLFNGETLDSFYTWYQYTGFGPTNNIIEVTNGQIRLKPESNPDTPTGRSNGALITNERYENYIAVLEFRWGEGSLISTRLRDAGIIIHGNGENGGWEGRFMPGLEIQKAEGEMGDLILLKDPDQPMSLTTTVDQVTCVHDFHCRGGFVWNPESTLKTFSEDVLQPPDYGHIHNRVWDRAHENVVGFRGEVDYESETGDWNQFIIVADGDQLDVYFNGHLVNSASGVFPPDGHLQLQLEWTEYFVRKFQLMPLASDIAPMISTHLMPSAQSNLEYLVRLNAASMTPPIVWSLAEGSELPEGLSLDPLNGEVTGIPVSPGLFDFVIAISDATGLSSSQEYSLLID